MNQSILPTMWKVPEIFRQRLGERAGRQRIMAADGHLLLILHSRPKPGDSEREAVIYWRTPDGQWSSTGNGTALAVLAETLGDFEHAADLLEARLSKAASARDYYDILRETAPLLRANRNQHATLQEAREAMRADRHLLLARDQSGETLRTLELVHQDATTAMDFLIAQEATANARASEQLARTGHRLNLLVAVFLPLTALGAAFGMNLRHGFEDESPGLFWMVLLAGLAAGLVIKTLVALAPKPSLVPAAPARR